MTNPTFPELARVQAQRDRLAEELRAMRAMCDEYRRQLLELLALYQPADAIREIWGNDTAETSLVLALLERCEAAEAEVERMRAVYEAALRYRESLRPPYCDQPNDEIGLFEDAIDSALAAGGKESK